MENNTSHNHKSLLHKESGNAYSQNNLSCRDLIYHTLKRDRIRKTLAAFLLLTLLFLGTTLFSQPTKSLATSVDITDTPTSTDTPTITSTDTPTPIPTITATPTQVPTATPSPTTVPTPRPTPRPQPTATPIPTVGATATVGTAPTAVPTQIVGGGAKPKPSPVPTKQPTATPTATAFPTPPPTATSPATGKKTTLAMQDTQHNSLPVVPLVVGTLLTLCLCGVGLLGYRRIRTARIPAVLANKSTNEYIGRPWYRVRPQQPRPIAPSQAAMPISPAPESPILAQLEGPKTGPVRRLSRIHLEKLMEEPANTWEKEV